jgi:pilus assembly protein CpaE
VTVTILCEPDQEVADVLVTFIEGDVRTVASLPIAALALDADVRRTLVVIGAGLELEQALQFTAQLQHANVAAGVILLRESPDAELLAQAAEAGIIEVVMSGDGNGLAAACHRFRTAVPAAISLAREPEQLAAPGRVITVFSAKGGCGKTTLATNLAVVLHAGGAKRVCLLDLDLGFGDVATTLQLKTDRTLADAVSLKRKLDALGAAALATPFRPGLDCILAPVGPGEAERVPATLVSDLLAVLPAIYDYVVVDTPAQFSEHVLAALDNSHHHVLMTTPEMPTLKSLRLTLDTLDLLSYRRRARSVVFNRSDSRVGLAEAEVEKVLRSPVACRIPSSWDVPASINRGIPLALAQPEHPVSVAVRRFAEAYLVAAPAPELRRFEAPDVKRWGTA